MTETTMTLETAREVAVMWQGRGVPAFLIAISWDDGKGKTNKRPLTEHGWYDATLAPDKLTAFPLHRGEVYGVGLHLGRAGLLAVDVDGIDNLAAWRAVDYAPTFEVTTASGSAHHWYGKRDADQHVGVSKECLPGVDVVCSDAQYVVAPGTVTPWGEWVSHDDWPEAVAMCPPEVWEVLDRTGGERSSTSAGGVDVRGLERVVVRLEADGRDQDAEALTVVCQRYGAHHPFLDRDATVKVTRPDKRAGVSATVGYVAPGVVFIFSTGWPELERGGRYVVHAGELVESDEIDELIGSATPAAAVDDDAGEETSRPLGLVITRLSAVEPEPVAWIWQGYVPLGKVSMLDGLPDLGKSTIAVDLASRVTTGAGMPDGSTSGLDAPAAVVLFTAEDGLADTVRPRVDAAGGDPERVHVVRAVVVANRAGKPIERWPTLADDLGALEATVLDLGARLVIVDVLMAYLGTETNSYRDQDMRAVLSPLAAMAERVGCAVVLLRHPTKGMNPDPVLAGGGSIGIVGAARVGLLVAFDPDDQAPPNERRRLLAVSKCNIAPKAPTMAYRIVQDAGALVARISWEGTTEHRAEQLTASAIGKRADSNATEVARELMEDLPMLAPDAHEQCRLAGLSHEAVLRALKRLGGCSKKLAGPIGAHNLGWAWFPRQPFADDIEAMRAEATARLKMTQPPEGDRLYEQSSSGDHVIFSETADPGDGVDL